MCQKIRYFNQRRPVAADGKRELHAVRALAESDLLLHAAIIRTGETGSGKTHVLSTRITWLLKAGKALPAGAQTTSSCHYPSVALS